VESGSSLTFLISPDSISEEDARAELAENDCDVSNAGTPGADIEQLTVNFECQNPIFRRELERVGVENYDSILVLTEERSGGGLSSDSRSMITMLLCRDLQKAAVKERGALTWGLQKPSTDACIIAEILDPRTSDLISLAKTDDHIVSNALISMALGQISEQCDLGILIDDLFSAEGNEIHIKDSSLYAFEGESLCFWEILNRARQRGEVALGYQRFQDVLDGAAEKGIVLNPADKQNKIVWNKGDKIVVLAED